MILFCNIILHKEKKRLTSIFFKTKEKKRLKDKKNESIYLRKTMNVKYEVESSDKKCKPYSQGSTMYINV